MLGHFKIVRMYFINCYCSFLPDINDDGKTSVIYKVRLDEVDSIILSTGEHIPFLLSHSGYDHMYTCTYMCKIYINACIFVHIYIYIYRERERERERERQRERERERERGGAFH